MGRDPGEPRTWSTELRAGSQAGAEARSFLSNALVERGDDLDLPTAKLLTSEVATNAARHGKEPIELSITLEDEGLRVSVFDRGSGFDPEQLNVRGGRTGGWGFRLVEELSSEWGVDRKEGRTEVWFRL
jgi:anti-sigma regulatory factor (Ser/Thr protein kinase)